MREPTIAQCEAEIVSLRKQLAAEQLAHAETRKKLEAAESRIKASQEQEPALHIYMRNGFVIDTEINATALLPKDLPDGEYGFYTSPVIPNYASALEECEARGKRIEELERENAELRKDAAMLDWFEDQYGLHRGLEITYVVDGYDIEKTYDGNATDGKRHHGKSFREAIDAAMKEWE